MSTTEFCSDGWLPNLENEKAESAKLPYHRRQRTKQSNSDSIMYKCMRTSLGAKWKRSATQDRNAKPRKCCDSMGIATPTCRTMGRCSSTGRRTVHGPRLLEEYKPWTVERQGATFGHARTYATPTEGGRPPSLSPSEARTARGAGLPPCLEPPGRRADDAAEVCARQGERLSATRALTRARLTESPRGAV